MPEKQVSVEDLIPSTDFPKVAETVIEEWKSRKEGRRDLEKVWKEIDRQLAMKPELSHKQTMTGDKIPERAWMPEIELPLQAQTLEMLTSDSRRMKFPNNRNWFKARAALTDDYLDRWNAQPTPFPGGKDRNARSIINQDNADRLVEGLVSNWHRQYDFRGNVDIIDAEAFAYGCGVGRVRPVRRQIMGFDAKPSNDNRIIPVYVPRSIKNTYLDTSQHALMHEGIQLGPNIIQWHEMNWADLMAAAAEGGDNPNSMDGGYVLEQVRNLTPDDKGNVQLIELEGDLVYELSRETRIVKNIVITAGIGTKGDKQTSGVVRVRKGEGFGTYVIHKYHVESSQMTYGTSPLMKGMPIAKAAAQSMNMLMASGQLKVAPPVGYNSEEASFAAEGGPVIEPFRIWESVDGVNVFDEVGGDPGTMFANFQGLVQLYADVTGVNPPRLGAQTKSHTTAFAKDVELQQGAVRTVDYVRSSLEGPMTNLLELEYRMGMKNMRGSWMVFIEQWNEFVEVTKKHMPDIVHFMAVGAGAPAEDALQNQQRLSAAQLAMQMEAFSLQLGNDPTLDVAKLIQQTLSGGGWTDVEAITIDAPEGQPGEIPSQIGALTEGGVAQAI